MMRNTTDAYRVCRRGPSALMLGCWLLLQAGPIHAQDDTDLQALAQETQKLYQSSDEVTLVWWLPEAYWQATLSQNPAIGDAQLQQFLSTIRPYTVIAVVAGSIEPFGGIRYESRDVLHDATTIRDPAGTTHAPLADEAVDPGMRNLMDMLRPAIANVLGPLGQNIQFMVFPARNEDGVAIVDPTGSGFFDVTVAEREFSYRLPLGSLLPARFDAETDERFPGNYLYNPFTGSELITR